MGYQRMPGLVQGNNGLILLAHVIRRAILTRNAGDIGPLNVRQLDLFGVSARGQYGRLIEQAFQRRAAKANGVACQPGQVDLLGKRLVAAVQF